MDLFKKKIKKIKGKEWKIDKNTFTETPNLDLSEIPREAMDLIYEHKMAEYEKCNKNRDGYMNSERADTLQKQLAVMSKYMRDDSMKSIIDYFEDKGFSKEKLKQADPETLRRMKQKMEDLDRAVENLYEKEPKEENINITINMENTKKTVDKIKERTEKDIEEEIEQIQEDIDIAEKDFDVITSPDDSKENEEYIESLAKEKSVQEKVLEELQKGKTKTKPKAKKKGFGLFKKKKLIKKKPPLPEPEDKPTHSTIKTDKLFQKEIKTPDLKKIFKKKEKEQDVFCPECKHLMKNHKSGCDKCGCLLDIDDIKQEIQEKENKVEEIIKETKEIEEVEEPVLIKKQLKQIQSMQVKKTPEVQKPKKVKLNPNKECTCEHFRKDHFEMTGFCSVKDCYCDEFRKYPHD